MVSELLALEQNRSAIALTLQAFVQLALMLWFQCGDISAMAEIQVR
jgi:hypothetical protein